MKKIGRFFSSMRFAIILLVVLAAACALCSTVTQGQDYDWYASRYGERTAGLIMAVRADDAFHSWWFIGLSAFLCLNLIVCNLVRLPSLSRRSRDFADPEKDNGRGDAEGTGDPRPVFAALRLPAPKEAKTADGREVLYAAGNRAGIWGAWVCHLGILLLIVGFALGQMTTENYTVYALPGQTRPLGNTGLTVTVDDFQVPLTEKGSVQQYIASLTVSDPKSGTTRSADASVNAPATLYGYKFFQNSVGWGADVRVLKDGKELQTEQLCAGEFFAVQDKPELVICLQAFYPDYARIEGSGPVSISEKLNNPAYLYQVYYRRQLLGMNALMEGEELTIDEYTVLFENPRRYTLLAVKRDRFTFLVLTGALVTLAGLVMALYLRPRSLKAVREGERWILNSRCAKGGILFREQYERALKAAGYAPLHAEEKEER